LTTSALGWTCFSIRSSIAGSDLGGKKMANDANALLLNLPWKIQVALASGYAAYLLGYRGIRAAHKAIDTAFITLMFGLIATGIVLFLDGWNALFVIVAAFVVTCAVAISWRKYFSQWLHDFMHYFDISWSNDDPSALASLSNNSRYRLTQVAVELDDGTWLRCDDARKFVGSPFGPLVLGPNGDVALYLTHEEPRDKEAKELKTVLHPDFGDRITYIPAARIRQITLRHTGGISRSSTVAES
jgi:hypothetical protein